MMKPAISCPLALRVAGLARAQPDATATESSRDVLTYRGLWDRVLWWSDQLSAFDPPASAVVAIVSDGSADLPAAFLGARVAGLVPLLVDTLLPRERRAAMLLRARPALVVDICREPAFETAAGNPLVLPRAAGYVVFSSGTQGAPKGIIGGADGLMNFLDWEAGLVGLGARARVPLLTSPSFDVVLREMFLPLATGGVLCVAGPSIRTDPRHVVPWLGEARANVVHAVPSLSMRWLGQEPAIPLSLLSWLLFAGEPLYAHHALRWRQAAPAARLVNLYGPSETTLAAFCHLLEEPPPAGLQPVGYGLPGVRLRASLPDRSAADGSFRVRIETPHGSLGYLPALGIDPGTSPLVRRDGITSFTTQDRGRLDSRGRLFIEGRLDEQVKRNGVLVDLADIEAKAFGSGLVDQACCVQAAPESTADIILAVAGPPGLARQELIGVLRRELGTAMPNEVMVFDRLPRLPNGKTDRRAVAEAVISRQEIGRASR